MKGKLWQKLSAVILVAVMLMSCAVCGGSITANAATVNEQEDNNNITTANTINIGDTINGSLSSNDLDFYKVVLGSSGLMKIEFTAYFQKMGFYIYDADGNSVFTWNNLEWNEITQCINRTANTYLNKGTYYICFTRAHYYTFGYIGDYNFKVNFETSNESFVETGLGTNNELISASSITLSKEYKGLLAINDGTDFYKFDLTSPTEININFTAYTEKLGFYLYDSNGGEVYKANNLEQNPTTKSITQNITLNLSKGIYYICFTRAYYYNFGYIGEYNFKVSPPEATSVKLNQASLTLDKGKSTMLTATILPTTTYNKTVTWTTSNSNVATVSDGKVTAKGVGTATITAKTSNGKTATCKVTVPDPSAIITDIKLNMNTLSLPKGKSQILVATFTPAKPANKTLTWTTSDSSVATVSGGMVNAVNTGTAIITAKTSNGKTATCKVTVYTPLANNSTLSATSITLGQTITAKGVGTGGMPSYQYQVVYKQTSQAKWSTAQAFNANSSVTFKPAKATNYDVCVKVKDSTGAIIKKFFTVTVKNSTLTNTSALSATTVKKGNKITAKCSATGGKAPYKYAVFVRKTTDTGWSIKQNFSTNANVLFSTAQVANYQVCIKVKDANGTIVSKYINLKSI